MGCDVFVPTALKRSVRPCYGKSIAKAADGTITTNADESLSHRDERLQISCSGADTFGESTTSGIAILETLSVFREWPVNVSAIEDIHSIIKLDLNTIV